MEKSEKKVIYTVTEVAMMLHLSKATIMNRIKSGEIKAFKLGGGKRPEWRIREDDYDEYIMDIASK